MMILVLVRLAIGAAVCRVHGSVVVVLCLYPQSTIFALDFGIYKIIIRDRLYKAYKRFALGSAAACPQYSRRAFWND